MAKVAVVVAPLPVLGRRHAVDQRAVIEHRQVEAAAVPRHELRNVAIDEVEEPADEFGFRILQIADGSDLEPGPVAQRAGNGDDLLQMGGHEIAARLGAALLRVPVEHGGIGQIGGNVARAPQARNVRHRFQVED